ncbi:MAG: hypothetical protein PHC34_07010 [Candidatus Gastranaerophilales bacterium]|nr:hypothetical protein [Candidatus Gastranaerophilales bacterium]
MKTININLIDDQTKESNKSKIEILTDDSDINPKVKFASIIIVISACIIFAVSFGIWSISSFMIKKTDKELTDLKSAHEKVTIKLSKSTIIHKNLQKEKKTLETKLLAQNLIDSSLLPWHKILVNISKAVPKDIKITEILKTRETKNSKQQDIIAIKGQISSKELKNRPLKTISFFILNINDNAPLDSNLEKSTVKNLNFDDKENIYNFEIVSSLKSHKKNQGK